MPSAPDASPVDDRADASSDAETPADDKTAPRRASEQVQLEVDILRQVLTAGGDITGEADRAERIRSQALHSHAFHLPTMTPSTPPNAAVLRIENLPARSRALPPGDLGDVFGACIRHQDPCGPEADPKEDCCGDLECQDLTPAGDLYRCTYP